MLAKAQLRAYMLEHIINQALSKLQKILKQKNYEFNYLENEKY